MPAGRENRWREVLSRWKSTVRLAGDVRRACDERPRDEVGASGSERERRCPPSRVVSCGVSGSRTLRRARGDTGGEERRRRRGGVGGEREGVAMRACGVGGGEGERARREAGARAGEMGGVGGMGEGCRMPTSGVRRRIRSFLSPRRSILRARHSACRAESPIFLRPPTVKGAPGW